MIQKDIRTLTVAMVNGRSIWNLPWRCQIMGLVWLITKSMLFLIIIHSWKERVYWASLVTLMTTSFILRLRTNSSARACVVKAFSFTEGTLKKDILSRLACCIFIIILVKLPIFSLTIAFCRELWLYLDFCFTLDFISDQRLSQSMILNMDLRRKNNKMENKTSNTKMLLKPKWEP